MHLPSLPVDGRRLLSYHGRVSLNLAQVFVRYPDVKGAAQAVEAYLAARLPTRPELPRHVCVATGTPWIGIFAAGNESHHDLAESVSRSLEAHAIWFGLSGRALAYRYRKFHLGRGTEDAVVPSELFGREQAFTLPAYADAENELYDRLKRDGIPEPYIFAMAEELGAGRGDTNDAVVVAAAPWSETGVQMEAFTHRLPKRPPGVRTLFDQLDEERTTIADAVLVRGTYDEARARTLFLTLQRMLLRRTIPSGWTVRYELESPHGSALIDPILALFARERTAQRLSYGLSAIS